MIKFLKTKEVLSLRNEVLRNGRLTNEECIFPGDELENSFHLGYFINEKLICVVTFHPQDIEKFGPNGYQLRGMATEERHRGKGYGNQLVNFAIVYLRGRGARYVWCNARKIAYNFYKGLGFEFISDEFIIPEIGPHKEMYLKIQ